MLAGEVRIEQSAWRCVDGGWTSRPPIRGFRLDRALVQLCLGTSISHSMALILPSATVVLGHRLVLFVAVVGVSKGNRQSSGGSAHWMEQVAGTPAPSDLFHL
jgi:hypothetical protein